jgi:pimeloyl-ACP methyl ester carboxylesterase
MRYDEVALDQLSRLVGAAASEREDALCCVARRKHAVSYGTMPVSRKLQLATGLTYHLLEWGPADAEHMILLVHGFLDHAWTWEPLVDAGLGAGGARLVAPDLRGHGDSDWVGAGGYYHFVDYLADLHDLVGTLAPRRLSIVGHSMGGSVAAYYAGSYPERVHRLALLEGLGPPESAEPPPERVRHWLAAWSAVQKRAPRSYASVEEAAARLLAHDPLLPLELATRLAEKGTTPALGGRIRFKHDPLHVTPGPYGFAVEFARAFWSRVRCPTLIVEGGQSHFRHGPEEAERRIACFGDVRRVTIEGAGHMMQRHQPAALAAALRQFLSD